MAWETSRLDFRVEGWASPFQVASTFDVETIATKEESSASVEHGNGRTKVIQRAPIFPRYCDQEEAMGTVERWGYVRDAESGFGP